MSRDNDFSQGPAPRSARKEVLVLTFAMLGLTSFPTNIWTGGTPGTGLSYHDLSLAVLIGNLLLGIHTSSLGYISARAGLITHPLTRFLFGVKGSWLPLLLLDGTQVGWFGVGVAMLTIPAGRATRLDINLLITTSGLLMTVTVFFGISVLTVLSVIVVLAIARLGGYSVWLTVSDMDGLDVLRAVVPVQPLDFNVTLTLVVGSSISAGTLIADFVRFGRNARLAVLVAMVAFFLGNSLMFIFDAAGATVLGMADISDTTITQGLLLPAIVVLGLSIWTTSDNALYASGLGFANITGMSSKTLSAINGITGTICMLWPYNNFVGWLTSLLAAIPPVGGVTIVDHLMNRRRYERSATTHMTSVNWVAILVVALGTAVGHWLLGIVSINVVLGGALSYLIFNPVLNRKTTATMIHMEANSVG